MALLDLTTQELVNLTNSGKDEYLPIWSPDSQWLAFWSADTQNEEQHLIAVNTANKKTVMLTTIPLLHVTQVLVTPTR